MDMDSLNVCDLFKAHFVISNTIQNNDQILLLVFFLVQGKKNQLKIQKNEKKNQR